MRKAVVTIWEGGVLLALFFSYFLQNIFVFDNLNTYILFYGFLGYSAFLISSPTPASSNRMAPRSGPGVYGFTVAGIIVFLFGGYFIHWKPMRESNTLLKALVLYQQRAPLPNIQSTFEKALSYHSFGDTEVREQLANVSRDVINNNQYSGEERNRFAKFAIDELKKELNWPAKDIKHMIFLASVLTRAGAINAQYLPEAEQIIKEAIALSPTKQILYLELAQLYLTQNRIDEALEVLRTTVKLEPSYDSATVNLFAVAQLARREDIVAEVRPLVLASIKTIGLELLDRAGNIFRERQEFAAAKDVYIELSSREPDNPKFLALASALLAELGEIEKAITYAEAAARLDPEFAKEAEVFIRQLKSR
jgi:tetratricopeptide (TPR) repeat protein